MRIKLTISLILAAMAIIFIIQNMMIVEISIFFWSISMPRSLMMFSLLVVGAAVGWFANSYFKVRKGL